MHGAGSIFPVYVCKYMCLPVMTAGCSSETRHRILSEILLLWFSHKVNRQWISCSRVFGTRLGKYATQRSSSHTLPSGVEGHELLPRTITVNKGLPVVDRSSFTGWACSLVVNTSVILRVGIRIYENYYRIVKWCDLNISLPLVSYRVLTKCNFVSLLFICKIALIQLINVIF